MNERRFKMTAEVVAVECENGCIYCAFWRFQHKCWKMREDGLLPPCHASERKDGKSVVFDIKQFKINERKTK